MHNLGASSPVVLADREIDFASIRNPLINVNPMPQDVNPTQHRTSGALEVTWMKSTPPKTDMEPKNEDLEDVFPFLMGDFQVPCEISEEYPIDQDQ